MKNEKIVNYKEIGTVLYRKNTRARNISIRISREGAVKVTVPRFCNYHTAEAFVLKKEDWIRTKKLYLERRIDEKPGFQVGRLLTTPEGKISIERGSHESPLVRQDGHDFRVILPPGFQERSEEGQVWLKERIGKLGLMEAKRLLPEYLQLVSSKYNFKYNRVTVRRMKSRWGSCSPDNNISLNSALIFLPYPLIEYVLLHELVHTIHKNHGVNFWNTVVSLMPDAKKRRKQLNEQEMI